MTIDLGRVTEREARQIIDAVREDNPELARVLQRRLDLATGTIRPRPAPTEMMFGRAR